MGLDMFLYRETYIGNQYRKEDEQVKITLPENWNRGTINQKKIASIREEVAYWRKANQIHRWFVNAVQDGVDNCGHYYVSKDDLQELIDACKQDLEYLGTLEKTTVVVEGVREDNKYEVFQNVDESKLNLPTQGGFFFGSTDYNEYYKEDLEDTIQQLEPLLAEGGDFYYSSSW